MLPSKVLQGGCIKPGTSFHGRNKFFWLVFSLITFGRFSQKYKNQLKTSLTYSQQETIKDI